MPRPIPDSLAAGFPEGLQQPSYVSEDTLRVLGGTGLPGDQAITRMGQEGLPRESIGTSWEQANSLRIQVNKMFGELLIADALSVPSIGELIEAGIDFDRLEQGYEEYSKNGLHPKVVFAPVNLSVPRWKEIFANLVDWQERTEPLPSNGQTDFFQGRRLKRQNDGNGLWIAPTVAKEWDGLNDKVITTTPGMTHTDPDGVKWKVLIVPTTIGSNVVNTSHDLSKSSPRFIEICHAVGMSQPTEVVSHIPIGASLVLQALRFYTNQEPMDSNVWAWNAGTFQDGQSLQAPASSWDPRDGQVNVDHYEVSGSRDFIGVRVPVWG
jgi:hypothetical protein